MSDVPFAGSTSTVPYEPVFRQADANRIAQRARYLADNVPYLADDPNSLLQMAQLPLDPSQMAAQGAAMGAQKAADDLANKMRQWGAGAQRAYFNNLSASKQQDLASVGYVQPGVEKGSAPGADLLGGIAGPLGAAWSGIYNVGSTGIGYGLGALQEAGELPMEMYRQIRMQPEWVQLIALGAAAVATGGLAAGALGVGMGTLGALGTGLGVAGSTLGVTGAAIGGLGLGYAVAGVLSGNVDYWADTFSLGREAGERDFTVGALAKAKEILEDDGQILSLARRFAVEGDPVDTLLREFGGQHDATSDMSMAVASERIATDILGLTPNTPEYFETMQALQALTDAPQFRAAVAHLQSEKISMGRDIANLFGLDPTEGIGKVVSGGADALSWFVYDPTLAFGKFVKLSRAARFGLSKELAGDELFAKIDKVAARADVVRKSEDLARHLNATNPTALMLQNPDLAGLWRPMKSWAEATAVHQAMNPDDFVWTAEKVTEFYKSQAGVQALAAGRAGAWRHGMIELPHISGLGRRAESFRLNAYNIMTGIDDGGLRKIALKTEQLFPEYFVAGDVITGLPSNQIWKGSNAVIDIVNNVPVFSFVAHPAASLATTLLTKIPSHGFIPLSEHAALGGQMVEEVTNFTRLGRALGVPRQVTDLWANAIINARNVGERHAAVSAFYDMMFNAVGVKDTAEGVELTTEFLKHAGQSYVNPNGKFGLFLGDQSELLAIPDIRALRKAAYDQTIYNKLLNVADADFFNAAVGKIWKPAVLLRIGFVTRAVGDEALSWLAREGLYGWVASGMARSIVDQDPVAGHLSWLDSIYQATKHRAIAGSDEIGVKGYLRKEGFPELVTDMDRMHIGFLEKYTEWLRRTEEHGILKLQGNNPVSKWATKDRTVRGLVLGGVPRDYLDAAKIWYDLPAVQASVMREVSAGRSVAADALGMTADQTQKVVDRLDGWDSDSLVFMRTGQWEKIDNTHVDASYQSIRGQQKTFTTDPEVMQAVNDHMLSRIDDKMAASLDSSGALPAIEAATTYPTDIRDVLTVMVVDPKSEAMDVMAGRLHPDDPIRKGWFSSFGKRGEGIEDRLAQTIAKVAETDQQLAQTMTDLLRYTRGDARVRGWAGRVVYRGDMPEMVRGMTTAQVRAEVRAIVRRELARPEVAARIERMEVGNRGARSGIPLANPAPENQLHVYVPYAPRQTWTALRQLDSPDAVKAWFKNRGIVLSKDAEDMLLESLHMDPFLNTGAAFPTGSVPLMGSAASDPAIAREVGEALNRVAQLEDVPTYGEMIVPGVLAGGGEGPEWVMGRTQHGWTINPVSGPEVRPIAAQTQLVNVKGKMVPGLTREQLLDEYADMYTDAVYQRFFSRGRTAVNPAGPVELVGSPPAPNPMILDGPGSVLPPEGFDPMSMPPPGMDEFAPGDMMAAPPMVQAGGVPSAPQVVVTEPPAATGPVDLEMLGQRQTKAIAEVDGRQFDVEMRSSYPPAYGTDSPFGKVIPRQPYDPLTVNDRVVIDHNAVADDFDQNFAFLRGEITHPVKNAKIEDAIGIAKQVFAGEDRVDDMVTRALSTWTESGANWQGVAEHMDEVYDAFAEARAALPEYLEVYRGARFNPDGSYWFDPAKGTQRYDGRPFESWSWNEQEAETFARSLNKIEDPHVWQMDYDQMVSEGMSPADARRYADRQQTGGVESRVIKTTIHRDDVLAILTGVQDELLVYNHPMTDMLQSAKQGERHIVDEAYETKAALDAEGIHHDELSQMFPTVQDYQDFITGVTVRQAAGRDLPTALREQLQWTNRPVDPAQLSTHALLEDNSPAQRYLWETNGPISVENHMMLNGIDMKRPTKHYEEANRYVVVRNGKEVTVAKPGKNEKVVRTEQGMFAQQEMERVPLFNPRQFAGSVVSDELPETIVAPILAIHNDTGGIGSKVTQFGFRKVIAPMIDSLMREPLAFHNFANSYVDAKRLSRHWLPPHLFERGERLTEVVRGDGTVAHVPAKKGRFVQTSEAWIARHKGKAFADLSAEETHALATTLQRIGVIRTGDRLEDVLPRVLQNRDEVRSLIHSFTARPEDGVTQARLAVDVKERTLAQVANDVLQGLSAPPGSLEAEERLIAWWRNIEHHPGFRTYREQLYTGDIPAQRRAARRMSEALHGPDLTPTQIRTVAEASDAMGKMDDLVLSTATERAIADTIPYIDRDNVRAQAQEYVRNLIPFWFAEDQFMRRWVRTAAHSPEMVRKAQLTYMGLKSGGIVQTDENGNDVFVYPGSTLVAELVGDIPFLKDTLPIATALTGQVRYALPGLDRFGQPSVSPLVSLPMQTVAQLFPETAPYLVPFSNVLQGDRGAGQGIVRSIVPASIMRFYDAVLSDEGDRKMASAMMSAAQVLEANGQGFDDTWDSDQVDAYIDKLKGHARSILFAQALFGFIAPSSPDNMIVGDDGRSLPWYDLPTLLGVDSPDVVLTDEYIRMVQTLGVEEGTIAFLKEFPDTTPEDMVNRNIAYRVGRTKSVSGAQLPPLNSSMQFYDDNKQWMEENPTAGAWLLPPAEDPADARDRDVNAYMEQQAVGLRKRKSPTEFIRDLKFASASATYFDTKEAHELQIAGTVDKEDKRILENYKAAWSASYLATHPIFAEELQSGEGRARRQLIISSLGQALQDPAAPQPWHVEGIRVLLDAFAQYKAAKIELSADSSKRGKAMKEALRIAFDDYGTQLIAMHPELAPLWGGVIRVEAKVD